MYSRTWSTCMALILLSFVLACGDDEHSDTTRPPKGGDMVTSGKEDMSTSVDISFLPDAAGVDMRVTMSDMAMDMQDVVDMADGGMLPTKETRCDDNEDEDGDGLPDCADPDCATNSVCQDIPVVDPATLPAQSGTGALSPGDFIDRWLDPNDPIQRGADRSKFKPIDVAMYRGQVIDTKGRPIAGARIEVLGQADIGYTLSQANGEFSILVPSGVTSQMKVTKAGHPEVQRAFTSLPRQMGWVSKPIVLTKYSPVSSPLEVGLNAPAQMIHGEEVTDKDGVRRPSVYMPPGTEVQFEMPDKSLKPAPANLTVRMTEYTVGELGPQAMPGDLPLTTSYTWAAEFSADEAVEAGATHVRFSKPVSIYLDNFLGFEVGIGVPFGIYEVRDGLWEEESDGAVGQVLAFEMGLAQLDLDGDGMAESDAELEMFGISLQERQLISERFKAGDQFWRVQTTRFSPCDMNWYLENGLFPPTRNLKRRGKRRRRRLPDSDDPCKQSGSVIDCGTQSLRDAIPVSGTPYSLVVQGSAPSNSIDFEVDLLSGELVSEFPSSWRGAEVVVEYAGRRIEESFTKDEVTQQPVRNYVINLNDAWGREVRTPQSVDVTVTYRFQQAYLTDTPFGNFAQRRTRRVFSNWFNRDGKISNVLGRDFFYSSRTYTFVVVPDKLKAPSLTVAHSFSPGTGTLNYGNGDTDELPAWGAKAKSEDESRTCENCIRPPIADLPLFGAPFSRTLGITPSGEIYGVGRLNIYENGDGLSLNSYDRRDVFVVFQEDAQGRTRVLFELPVLPSDPEGRQSYAYAQGSFPGVYIKESHEMCFLAVDQARFLPDAIRCVDLDQGTWRWLYKVADADLTLDAGEQVERIWSFAINDHGDLFMFEEVQSGMQMRRITAQGNQEVLWSKQRKLFALSTEIDPDRLPVYPNSLGVDLEGLPAFVVSIRPSGSQRSMTLLVVLRPQTQELDVLAGQATASDLDLFTPENKEVLAAKAFVGINTTQVSFDRLGGAYIYSRSRDRDLGTSENIIARVYDGTVSAIGPVNLKAPREQCRRVQGLVDASSCTIIGAFLVSRNFEIHAPYSFITPLQPIVGDQWQVDSPSSLERYLFDHAGRILTTSSRLTGKVIRQFEYDDDKNLVAIQEVSPQERATLEWSEQRGLESITSSQGAKTTLQYDANLFVSGITHPSLAVDEVSYDVSGFLSSRTTPEGHQTDYMFSSGGALTQVTLPDGLGVKTLSSMANGDGTQVTFTDPLGLQTLYQREVNQEEGTLLRRVTYPWGASAETLVTTTEEGTQREVTQLDGTVITWSTASTLDANAIQSKRVETSPSGQSVAIERSLRTNPTAKAVGRAFDDQTLTIAQRAGNVRRQWTSSWNWVTKRAEQSAPNGARIQYEFNDQGEVLTSRYAGVSNPLEYTYNPDGTIATETQGTMQKTYTWLGSLLKSSTDALGNTYTWTYNDRDWLTQLERPDASVFKYEWDKDGMQTAMETPLSRRYTMTHDALGNLTSFKTPGGREIQWAYEAGQRLKSVTFPSGAVISSSYDTSGRLAQTEYPEATIRYTYDNPTTLATKVERLPKDPAAPVYTAQRTYEGAMTLSTTETFDGELNTVSLGRNGFLEVTSITDGADVLDITRDQAGLVTGFGDWAMTRSGPMRAPTAYTRGPFEFRHTYDRDGRLSGKSLLVNRASKHTWTRTFDAAGQAEEDTVTLTGSPAIKRTYTFNKVGALTQVSQDGLLKHTYGWDLDGNRTLVDGVTAQYDADSQLNSFGGAPLTWSLDGQLLSDGMWQTTYSTRGELLKAVRISDNLTITYGWDIFGRMRSRSSPSETLTLRYTNPGHPFQITQINSSISGVTKYTYDHSGHVIEMQNSEGRFAVVTDSVGTPLALFDEAGQLSKEIDRTPFGLTLSETPTSWSIHVGFAGGFEDPDTGMVRFGARDYHPTYGRWTAIDPTLFSGSPTNLWLYAENNPLQYRDPTGLFCIGGSGYAGAGGGIEGCLTVKGFALCAEIGLGAGGGVSFKPFGELPKSEAYELEATLKVGFLGASAEGGGKLDECGGYGGIAKVGIGPLTKDLLDNTGSDLDPNGIAETLNNGTRKSLSDAADKLNNARSQSNGERFKNLKVNGKLEGKVSAKKCKIKRW